MMPGPFPCLSLDPLSPSLFAWALALLDYWTAPAIFSDRRFS